MHSYIKTIRNFAILTGRTSRKEYWTFILIDLIIGISLLIIGLLIDYARGDLSLARQVIIGKATIILFFGYYIFRLIPYLSATVRRLHDANHSGLWALPFLVSLALHTVLGGILPVPFLVNSVIDILAIVTIFFLLLNGTPGENKYGVKP